MLPRANTARLIVRVAWRNVRRNWRHSLAALGTMAVGFVALALFQGYLDEMLRTQLDLVYSRNMIGEVMVRKPGAGTRAGRAERWKYQLDEADQQFLEAWIAAHPADVKTRVRTLLFSGMAHAGSSTAEFFAWGHDIPEARVLRRGWVWNAWAGHPLREDEPSGALLGLTLATRLGCVRTTDEPVMDPATGRPRPVERPFRCREKNVMLTADSGHGRVNALEAEVVGFSSAGVRDYDERMVWLPLAFTQDLAATHNVSHYMIALHHPADGARVRAELSAAARQAGRQLEVVDWKDTEGADLLRRGMELLAVYRRLVVLVILVIAGAAVLTSMMKTVHERTREVGTMRSLGYRGRHLLSMFAVEAVLLALHAGAAGLAVTTVATALLNAANITYKAGLMAESIPLRIGYSPGAWALGFLYLSLVAVTAALVAARRVARMRIAGALSES